MPKALANRPSFWGAAGVPTTTTGIVTDPGGNSYSEVRLGDVYIDTSNGKWYSATAVSASSITWTVLGTQT